MNTIKVLAYPKNISDADLIIYSQGIKTSVSANTNFSSLNPYLISLQTANVNLNAALLAQKPGDKTSTSNLHEASNEVKRILRVLASSVEFTSNNNKILIHSSGFGVKKPIVRDAKSFNAKQGKTTGTAVLEINSYGNAAYQWEISPDPIGVWSPLEVTIRSKTTVSDLVAGTKYWFRVAVITSSGKTDYTDPHMVHVI
jgi:hypothetical protein